LVPPNRIRRRCGISTLLEAFKNVLLNEGVEQEKIDNTMILALRVFNYCERNQWRKVAALGVITL